MYAHKMKVKGYLPVAPSGWPLDIRPPEGLITNLPPYVLSPLSTSSPAFPRKKIQLGNLLHMYILLIYDISLLCLEDTALMLHR